MKLPHALSCTFAVLFAGFLSHFAFANGEAVPRMLPLNNAPAPIKMKTEVIVEEEVELGASIAEELNTNIRTIDMRDMKELLAEADKDLEKRGYRKLDTGVSEGEFLELQHGDIQHLLAEIDGKRESFWCGAGCEVFDQTDTDMRGRKIAIHWDEVESLFEPAGEVVRRKQTFRVELR